MKKEDTEYSLNQNLSEYKKKEEEKEKQKRKEKKDHQRNNSLKKIRLFWI